MISESINLGGVETHILTLAEMLMQKKLEIVVVFFSNNKDIEEEFHKIGAKCYFLPMQTLVDRSRRILYMVTLLLQFPILAVLLLHIVKKERVDIIHSHISSVFSSSMAYAISKICRIPIVFTVHGKPQAFPRVFRYIIKNCSGLIVISYELRDYLIRFFEIKNKKIQVIYNGINLERYHPNYGNKSNSEKKRILHVTRLDYEKMNATIKLIEAVPEILMKLPETEIIIIGGGEKFEDVFKQVEKMNEKTGKDSIKMVGTVSPTSLLDYLTMADVVVGVGRVAIEGMACGKPVVIVGNHGLSGVITEENKEKIKYYNFSGRDAKLAYTSHQLAVEIIRLFANNDYYESTSLLGLKILEEELDIKKIAKQIEKSYVQALNKI